MEKEKLEELRIMLNELVVIKGTCLHDGEVLRISQKLDELINSFEYTKGKVAYN